jgi:hypothetical protein
MVAMLAACAHKKPPPPAPPPPPPPPTGDKLRLGVKPGDEIKAKVKLAITQDFAGKKEKHLSLSFDFLDEEKVQAVDQEGTAQVNARLVDAVGQAATGANQQTVDDFALALDELKIQFKRSARGEIVGLMLSGLRPPLEEQTARSMLNAMFSAQRGSILPEPPVDVGQKWSVTSALPPSTGFAGQVKYEYTYSRKGGGVAVIGCTGQLEGKSASDGRTMIGTSTGEYRVELNGRLIGALVEMDTNVAQSSGKLTQHVRAEWTLDAAPEEKQ